MKSDDQKIFIEGPVGVSEYFSKNMAKHIYLFSDLHHKDKICTDVNIRRVHINDFLVSTLTDNADKVIDFYLEADFHSKRLDEIGKNYKTSKEPSYLKDVRLKFNSCFLLCKDKVEKLCKYKNVRFHYSDVRVSMHFLMKLRRLENILRKLHDVNVNSLILTSCIKKSAFDLLEESTEMSLDHILDISKVNKQFNHINDSNIRGMIIEYWMKLGNIKYTNMINTLRELSSYELPRYNIFKQHKLISDHMKNLSSLPVFVMDAYLIGRMFRSFDQNILNYSKDPKFIIVYAGREHIKNYADFFEYIGIKLIAKNTSDEPGINYQCIKLNIQLPFFYFDPFQ